MNLRNLLFVFVLTGLVLAAVAVQSAIHSPQDELVSSLLEALDKGDRATLLMPLVDQETFERVLWPKFPNARPEAHVSAGEAWAWHQRAALHGLNGALTRWQGTGLKFASVQFDRIEDYGTFRLFRGTTLTAVRPNGETAKILSVGSLVERNGVFSVLTYRDR